MSLSTITPEDAPSKRKVFKERPMTSLNTDDISGSKPQLKPYQYINKPEFSNITSDIERALPRKLHQSLNKPELNLRTNDIENSHVKKFKSTRFTNPLNPVYKLASVEAKPITPPKFVRDSVNIEDISGAKPEKYHKFASRDTISVKDIEGARPKPERVLVKPNFMNPKDINGEVFHTKRQTNPLEPSYVHRDEDGNLVSIGNVFGSKPKKGTASETNLHRRNLDNGDIFGTKPGTLNQGPFVNKDRNYSKKLVDNSDIAGCQPGSHSKGIVTKRVTNPLDPKYVWTTEEEVKETEKKDVKNENQGMKVSQKNNEAFWGTNKPVEKNVVVRPATCVPISSSFKRNVNKFYEASMDSQSEAFKVNSENFFDNPQSRLEDRFLAGQNPKSIHRKKKEEIAIKNLELGKDTRGFFGEGSNSSRPGTSSSYQFKLSRREIGTPVDL